MQIRCPACEARLNIPPHMMGRAVRCPKCGNQIAPDMSAMGRLGDYNAALPYRVIMPKGDNELGQAVTPIDPPQGCTMNDLCALIRNMPFALVVQQRKQLMLPGRDAQWFFRQSAGAITIPAGSALTEVCSYALAEKFGGALEEVGGQVITTGAADKITWTLVINGQIHPDFAGVYINMQTMTNMIKFRMELVQNRTIQLCAQNSDTTDVAVIGSMLGWSEFLQDFKDWGTSPESGIG